MIPDVASILRKRYRMQRTLRFLAVILLTLWVILAGYAVVEIGNRLGRDSTPTFGTFALEFLSSLPFLIVGAGLGLGSAVITKWILPFPKSKCPRCSYRLFSLTEPRCPECGLPLPREMLTVPNEA